VKGDNIVSHASFFARTTSSGIRSIIFFFTSYFAEAPISALAVTDSAVESGARFLAIVHASLLKQTLFD
jgi:hypothetical protein